MLSADEHRYNWWIFELPQQFFMQQVFCPGLKSCSIFAFVHLFSLHPIRMYPPVQNVVFRGRQTHMNIFLSTGLLFFRATNLYNSRYVPFGTLWAIFSADFPAHYHSRVVFWMSKLAWFFFLVNMVFVVFWSQAVPDFIAHVTVAIFLYWKADLQQTMNTSMFSLVKTSKCHAADYIY